MMKLGWVMFQRLLENDGRSISDTHYCDTCWCDSVYKFNSMGNTVMERTVGKYKKPRKPMSEKNRIQAAERLKEAREKRLRENPPKYTNIHPSVRALPDDQVFSRVNVTKWIKTQKSLLSAARTSMRNKVKGATQEYYGIQGYIRHCEWYLKNGDWIDNFYGEYQQNRTKWRTLVPAGKVNYEHKGIQEDN